MSIFLYPETDTGASMLASVSKEVCKVFHSKAVFM